MRPLSPPDVLPLGEDHQILYSSSLRSAAPCLQAELTHVQQILLQKPLPQALRPAALHAHRSVTQWGHQTVPPGPSGEEDQGRQGTKTKWHRTCRVNDTVQDVTATQRKPVLRP